MKKSIPPFFVSGCAGEDVAYAEKRFYVIKQNSFLKILLISLTSTPMTEIPPTGRNIKDLLIKESLLI